MFFLLFPGIPCLLAFFGGLIPLVSWFMRCRTKQGEVERTAWRELTPTKMIDRPVEKG